MARNPVSNTLGIIVSTACCAVCVCSKLPLVFIIVFGGAFFFLALSFSAFMFEEEEV